MPLGGLTLWRVPARRRCRSVLGHVLRRCATTRRERVGLPAVQRMPLLLLWRPRRRSLLRGWRVPALVGLRRQVNTLLRCLRRALRMHRVATLLRVVLRLPLTRAVLRISVRSARMLFAVVRRIRVVLLNRIRLGARLLRRVGRWVALQPVSLGPLLEVSLLRGALPLRREALSLLRGALDLPGVLSPGEVPLLREVPLG